MLMGDHLLSFPGEANELQIQYQTLNNQPMQWFLNNQPWQPSDSSHPKLSIKPGNWSLRIQQNKVEHQVNFMVEPGPGNLTCHRSAVVDKRNFISCGAERSTHKKKD